jgi:hypothetical protein
MAKGLGLDGQMKTLNGASRERTTGHTSFIGPSQVPISTHSSILPTGVGSRFGGLPRPRRLVTASCRLAEFLR